MNTVYRLAACSTFKVNKLVNIFFLLPKLISEKIMKLLRRLFLVGSFLLLCQATFATNVVFYCVQNQGAYEKAGEITTRIEDFVFDAFFDLGLITGNVPFTENNEETLQNVQDAQKALEYPSDYILIINAAYSKQPSIDKKTNEKFAQVEKVDYALFNVKTEKFIFQKTAKFTRCETKNDLLKKLEKVNLDIIKNVTKKVAQGA